MAIWDERQRDAEGNLEPLLWFGRLQAVLQHGSKLAAYNAEREKAGKSAVSSVPGAWNDAAAAWNWNERLEAYQTAEIERVKAEFKAERQRRRQRRQELLEKGFNKLEKLVEKLDEKTSVAQLSMLFNALYQNERAEFDDEPAARLKLGDQDEGPPTFNIIINKVPARAVDNDAAGKHDNDQSAV